jgi:hypothetical protein
VESIAWIRLADYSIDWKSDGAAVRQALSRENYDLLLLALNARIVSLQFARPTSRYRRRCRLRRRIMHGYAGFPAQADWGID